MASYEIPGVGRIYTEDLGKRSTRVCAEIADYMKICLTMDVEPLKEGIDKEVEEVFQKYKSILVNGFVQGLTYVATMIEVEARAGKSPMFM